MTAAQDDPRPRPEAGPEEGKGVPPLDALRLARGVCRMLADWGYRALTEFTLANGRRADVIGLAPDGRFVVVEIKTSEADYLSDQKWEDYLEFCDLFYFAVPEGFPRDLLPDDVGVLVADAWGAEAVRRADEAPLHPSRRRAQLLSFALTAGDRLHRLVDPRT